MKCPICKGAMKIIKDTIPEDGLSFDAYRCTSCGEELMNIKQLKLLASKYRRLRKARDTTFAKWGNSLAVRIPRDMAGDLGIIEGKHGLIIKEKEGIKIIPA